MTDDYDRLSPIGRRQGEKLGDYWGKRGLKFNQVYVGPLRRHQQTFNTFSTGYEQHGLRLAQPTVNNDFIEHEGFQLSQAIAPQLVGKDAYITEHYRAEGMDRKTNLRVFQHVMHLWAEAKVSHPDFDSWQNFRANVARGLKTVTESSGSGQNVLVFTSGGTISAAMGHVLGLSDLKSIQLNWVVRNTAYAEFRFSKGAMSLSEFNAIPHIENDELHTYV